MEKNPLKSRLKAGGIHLLFSSLIVGVVVALALLVLYPAPLASTQGVVPILLLLVCVDVVMGPLITTIVFDRRKKSLKLDLATVVVLQLAALIYGVHAIYTVRPALIVYAIDRFEVIPASDMDPASLKLAQTQGKPGLPWLSPRLVAAELPKDPKQRSEVLMSAVVGGADIPQLAQYHIPYEQASAAVLARMRPLAELQSVNSMDDSRWQAFLASLPEKEETLAYLPLLGKTRDGVVIVDRKTAKVVRMQLLQPKWSS